MSSSNTVNEDIRASLEALLGPEVRTIGADQSFRDFIGERFDSLMAVEVVTTIEERFGIEVDFVGDDVRYWFETLEKMEQFVKGRLEDNATLQAV
ncbi:acyl carrier protein [Pseudomonas sp. ADAK2]|uniref:acyl carrier protein n=1 Tax=unclassified Pseudomonas TaxID=196821 RepID=UPI001462E9A7|nr:MULTISPECIES: acyl carrier protein [unclassified Pseudomonas]QJI40775.1 acyl carrier protein [Pseudomonas sp. ADAK7]QJI47079.1 acyl carrier protein [Pseudomonas sp. ADAK2]